MAQRSDVPLVRLTLPLSLLVLVAMSVLPASGCLTCSSRSRSCEESESATTDTRFHTLTVSIGQCSVFLRVQEEGTDKVLLEGHVGLEPPSYAAPPQLSVSEDVLTIAYGEQQQRLTVLHRGIGDKHTRLDGPTELPLTGHEYELMWESEGQPHVLRDEFIMTGAHWYGATEIYSQLWPMEKWNRKPTAYVTGDSYNDQYGGVQERYWLSSKGVAIFVDYEVPLFVGVNESNKGKLTFISKFTSPFQNVYNRKPFLKYFVSHSSDVRNIHQYASNTYWRKPTGIPDERMFRHPVWSTWAKYKKNIDQQKALQFATEIRQHGFKDSQLEIDDDWTPHYGDLDFDRGKFPDPKRMVEQLKGMDFRVTLWVHPFASILSHAIHKKDANGTRMWIRVPGFTNLPAVVHWWDGLGAVLDTANPAAVGWFKDSLNHLRTEYGVDSFKYDAGESSWLPRWRKTFGILASPNDYTRAFADLAAAAATDSDIRCQEVRASVQGQHHPMFVRLMDKDSNWGLSNGLQTLIPHVLTFGLIGYPFVLPDMIGGNAYGFFIFLTSLPERELYIRWLEANALLPAVQFSVTPWQYDNEVVDIAHQMLALRAKYADKIINLARDATVTGAPIIRPLWWISPADEDCLTVDSQYLVGDDLLVAPVLEEGARTRDVYLPAGRWHDELRDQMLDGGQWHRNYKAELHELPHFTLI